MKTTKLVGMLVAAMMVSVASAGVTFLPESSHYMGQLVDTTYDVRIEFAVYDTEANPDEFTAEIPGDGRFVYAYQVFNLSSDSEFSVDLFTILGIGEGALASDDAIGSADDANGGIATTGQGLNDDMTEAAWTFENGSLTTGNQSFFLLLSSDSDYVSGSYEINTSDFVVPGGQPPVVPEPASLILLAAGGALFIRKR